MNGLYSSWFVYSVIVKYEADVMASRLKKMSGVVHASSA